MTTIDKVNQYDQFDFEQQIMECWNVTTDIKTVNEYLLDAPLEEGREDKIANMLMGIESLYNAKFDKLFRMFEQFNRERYELLKMKEANYWEMNQPIVDEGGSIIGSVPKTQRSDV